MSRTWQSFLLFFILLPISFQPLPKFQRRIFQLGKVYRYGTHRRSISQQRKLINPKNTNPQTQKKSLSLKKFGNFNGRWIKIQ
ncbi:hypothetical protein E1A91_A07G178500v1 [Gossypium mustelinum]|uniref:Uncharacterized protein n=1 Tax=Gossypium mustelinum TaxID=34275 RepID=A0A5D2YLK5_GOSMU|nr:hypothetical protein E1A91_A07G178500v1 [Gossypium mustelinum]